MLAQLSDIGAWNWFLIVVALFMLDMLVPGAHFLWFRFAAVGVGILALTTGIGWQWQLMAFGVFSVLAALFIERHVRPDVVKSDVPDLNARGQQYVGRMLMVEQAIDCGRGKVRVGDTLWCAEGPDAPLGSSVLVTGVRGTVLLVERSTH
jgi:membrane protein implicated in regulation of membrane protease activity